MTETGKSLMAKLVSITADPKVDIYKADGTLVEQGAACLFTMRVEAVAISQAKH